MFSSILSSKHTYFAVKSFEANRACTCIRGNSILTNSAIVARIIHTIINIYEIDNE